MSAATLVLTAVLVALLGGVGSVLRLYLGKLQGKLPWGILAANVVASAWVGLMSESLNMMLATVIIIGFAGGLSTFSTFAAQTVDFLRQRRITQALWNLVANLGLSTGALILGQAIGAYLLKW
jgi:CrcB protein